MPTVSYGIAATADDGCQVGTFGFFDTNPGAGYDSGSASNLSVGFRFLSVAVPQGATITSASLTLKTDSGFPATGSAWGTIKGVSADNAPSWTTTSPAAASKTIQSVAITSDAAKAYDVTTIIQAIVSRTGWASGNALAFAGDPTGANGYIYFVDRAASAVDCAQLSITYTTGGGAGAVNASLTSTLGAMTSVSAGLVTSSGSLSQALAGATLSAVAAVALAASLTASLGDATVAGAGTVANPAISAALDATLDGAALGSDASIAVAAAVATAFDDAQASGSGVTLISGAADAVLIDATTSSDASIVVTGAASVSLDSSAVTSDGIALIGASASASFNDLSMSASAVVPTSGALTATLGSATLSSSGGSINVIVGDLSISLADATSAGSGSVWITGTTLIGLDGSVVSSGAAAAVEAAFIAALEPATVAADANAALAANASAGLADASLEALATVPVSLSLYVTLQAATVQSTAINGELPPVPETRHVVLIGRRRTASLTARVRVASLTGRTRKIIR